MLTKRLLHLTFIYIIALSLVAELISDQNHTKIENALSDFLVQSLCKTLNEVIS